jgi:hypothetical protein
MWGREGGIWLLMIGFKNIERGSRELIIRNPSEVKSHCPLRVFDQGPTLSFRARPAGR